jgi:hypothetical protein
MSDNFKDLFLLSTLILLLLSWGCAPLKPNRVAAVALTAEDVARAAAKQHDPTIIRAGSPAYLMLVDGLIEAYPNNSRLLVAGCKAYTSYASAFLEDEDQGKASPLYAKAKHYGFRRGVGRIQFGAETVQKKRCPGTILDSQLLGQLDQSQPG